jgi:SAM-dependent methyltransferase
MLDREAPMTTLTQQIDWASWLTRWHRQQERYLHDRSRRFSIMLDYVEHLRGRGPLALIDLCCGPGSIAAAALTRFDTATVLACDIDPWLIEMGRRTLGSDPRVEWLEADLRTNDWTEGLTPGGYDAVLTSTALHWLHRDELVRLYDQLAGLLAPGGLLLNADHQPVGRARIAAASHERKQREADAELAEPGAESWEGYWEAARAEPAFAGLLAERDRRFANRRRAASVPVEFHRQALLAAGFDEVGEVWRHHDDAILLAIR